VKNSISLQSGLQSANGVLRPLLHGPDIGGSEQPKRTKFSRDASPDLAGDFFTDIHRLWLYLLRQFVTEFFDQIGKLSYR